MTTHINPTLAPPPPPDGLSKTERRTWTETVESFPYDWFRSSDLPLLVEMIRAHDMSNQLAMKIRRCKDDGKLKLLLEMRDRECRRAAALATKMRMPPQSRSDRHLAGAAASRAGALRRPWEDSDTERFFADKRKAQ